jgi:UDP-sulfoquinovose synthase
MNNKNIIIIGGDGFCGWPLSLRLSSLGANVLIIDNLSRRIIDEKLGSNSLTPISSIYTRISTWEEITNKKINFELIDVAKEYDKLFNIVSKFKPDTIIHLGEQRAAPYSMKDNSTRRYTVDNNLNGTHNILNVIVELDKNIHLIHLGTAGTYGYGLIPNVEISEGYIEVQMKDLDNNYKNVEILHPFYPGSVYHMTKSQDELFFQFYAKNFGLRITDLHQGIIWGQNTKETMMDIKLINRLDYDSDYGTVFNRFIIQAANNIPLTIYGTGEQTRAFIHIENSMDCICLAINNPPNRNDRVMIYNQTTEQRSLNYLVDIIKSAYPDINISNITNPRKEMKANDLKMCNNKFISLGLKPILIDTNIIKEIYEFAKKYNNRINMKLIQPLSFW